MKRLIICCDGTWNRADQVHDGVPCPTNVTKLFHAIAPVDHAGVQQLATYHEGVGVKRLERLIGGAGGFGLSRHIRDVYTWLVENFEAGDELFLFGFSRGAYTARSTVGLIRTCGILHRHHRDMVKDAYRVYRGAEDKPDNPEALEFRAKYSTESRIRFIGVWDTVGALGIPLSGTRWVNIVNRHYTFHNVTLSSRVDAAYQALAINEQRGPFTPAVWEPSERAEGQNQQLEQVWFAGVHSDVGGGYPDRQLADLTLRWMSDRARRNGLALTDLDLAPVDDNSAVHSTLHDSYKGVYTRIRPYLRVIGATSPAANESASSTAVRRLQLDSDYDPPGLRSFLAQPRVTDIGASARRDPATDPATDDVTG